MEKNRPAPPGLSHTSYRAMLAATILASSMAFIDGTALNVALPVIQKELALNGTQLLWIINGYLIFLSSLMLIGGGLGDIYGKKRTFITGIILFSLASALCGFSANGNLLILFRCIQGMGAALMIPGSLALITSLVPVKTRGEAIGWWSMFSALTTVLGPVLGGWLAGAGLWRVIFFLNIPLAMIALWLLYRYVPYPPRIRGEKPDWPGALWSTLMLAGISYGLIKAGDSGFELPQVQLALTAGAIAGILFVVREFRTDHPMIPPGMFRTGHFSAGNIITVLMYAALGGFLFFYPLNLIQVQGYSSEITGLTLVPFALLIAGMSYFTGRWVDRYGPRTFLILGQMLQATGYFLFSIPEITHGPQDFFASYFVPILVLGLGMGLSVVPVTATVMNSVPDTRSGTASGINNTLSRASQVIAIAVLGGMALAVFQENVLEYLQDYSPDLLSHPDLSESLRDMAQAELPDTVQSAVFNEAVDLSFVLVFRMVALIASILTACSTLLAYMLIGRKK